MNTSMIRPTSMSIPNPGKNITTDNIKTAAEYGAVFILISSCIPFILILLILFVCGIFPGIGSIISIVLLILCIYNILY
jgi:hypothetical protein